MMDDTLLQDEPSREAERLSKWFASRIDARWAVRRAIAKSIAERNQAKFVFNPRTDSAPVFCPPRWLELAKRLGATNR